MKSFRTSLVNVGLAMALTSVTLAGCGASSPSTGKATSSSTGKQTTSTIPASAEPSSPPATGLLAFSAPLVGGGQFDGASMVGKPVAFWFWAPT